MTEIERIASEAAKLNVPAENGIFDARERLQYFTNECHKRNYIPFLGTVGSLMDARVDFYIDLFELNS